MLIFKGIQKTTLIDFPGRVACTLFLPRCNFKCPFCYNRQLVLDEDTGAEITQEEALAFLEERKNFLDGVCITGGEPLLHTGILQFCKKVRQLGLLVKLDTNGSLPEMLQALLEEKALDFIAMDIKNCLPKYDAASGVKADKEALQRSVSLIRESGLDYEFRTTVVPSLHAEKDLLEIGKWLKGSKRFFLQQFKPDVQLLDRNLESEKPYGKEELLRFAGALKPFFGMVAVRGI